VTDESDTRSAGATTDVRHVQAAHDLRYASPGGKIRPVGQIGEIPNERALQVLAEFGELILGGVLDRQPLENVA
jgi:hypothetical protein